MQWNMLASHRHVATSLRAEQAASTALCEMAVGRTAAAEAPSSSDVALRHPGDVA